jgi:hypothetical protein
VRIVLDECVPRGLMRALADLDVAHVVDLGWSGRRNGVLLASMLEAGFAVFLTVDRNLAFQQNIPAAGVSIIVLHATKNRVQDLVPLMPEVRAILTSAEPGKVYHAGV